MSGMMNKVKNALHSDKKTPEAAAANQGNNEYGDDTNAAGRSTGSGLESGEQGGVAHGSHTSPTNEGFLHSTQRGIHGDRDPGTSGYDNSTGGHLQGEDGLAAGGGVGSGGTGMAEQEANKHHFGHGSNAQQTDTTTHTTSTGGNTVTGGTAGPQFTGDNTRDTGLVGSGLTGSGAQSSETGTGLAGAGSGYSGNNRDRGVVDGGAVAGTGLAGSEGSSHHHHHHHGGNSGMTGSNEPGTGYSSTSGNNTTDYDSSNTGMGSGLSGSNTGSNLTGTDSSRGMGSGLGATGGSSTGMDSGSGVDSGSGMGSAPGYVEGSEKHHRGDGHPEDIVHPGPHLSQTAKALDPHLN